MPSLKRILASRANGAKSRGPVTPEGKRRVSSNAVRHGLLARAIVLEDESSEGFRALFDQHLERLQPADGVELGMIEEMAASYWRLRRAWAIETCLMDQAIAQEGSAEPLDRITGAFRSLTGSGSLALLHRYETRLHSMYQRALRNLLLLRAVSAAPGGAGRLPAAARSHGRRAGTNGFGPPGGCQTNPASR